MTDINIKLPAAWDRLTDLQASQVISIIHIAKGLTKTEALTICALRTAGLRIITADKTGVMLRIPPQHTADRSTVIADIPYARLQDLIKAISWVLDMPSIPWRPSRMMLAKTTNAQLNDLTFGQYLQLDALYTAHINSPDPEKIRRMAKILVPKAMRAPAQWEQQAIIIWLASVKTWLAQRYRHLYTTTKIPGTGGSLAPEAHNLQDRFDAQLRALTKGDPLKEDSILALPLHRALTELNAQAAEAAQIRSLTKKPK